MDLTAISATISSLKAATDLAKGIFTISKQALVQEKVIELQSIILSLNSDLLSIQSEYAQILSKNNYLEQKIKEFDDWKEIQDKYILKKVGNDVFVYALREDTEPNHWLCSKCFNDRKISILQRRHPDSGIYECHTCKAHINLPAPPPKDIKKNNGPNGWMSA